MRTRNAVQIVLALRVGEGPHCEEYLYALQPLDPTRFLGVIRIVRVRTSSCPDVC